MKKLVIILICLVIICGVGLPIANGIIMERAIKSAVEDNNKKMAKAETGFKVKILEYDRGLFSSRIKWSIDDVAGIPGAGSAPIILINQGKHGYLGITSQTDLRENPKYMEWVKTHLDGKDPLSIQSRLSVTGSIDSTIHLDAFSFEENGNKVDVHALDLDVTTGTGFDTVKTKGTWQGFCLGSDLVIGPVSITSDLNKLTEMLWVGENRVSLEKLTIDRGQEKPFVISGLSINSDTRASDDKKALSTTTEFHVDQIELVKKPLSDWAATLKLNNLDTASLDQVMTLYSKIMTRIGQQIEKTGNPLDLQKAMEDEMEKNSSQLMAALSGLLKRGMGIEITKLDIALPMGKIKGDLNISLKQDFDPSNILMFVMEPDQLLAFFNLGAQVTLPPALANNEPRLTQPLFPGMSTGLFVANGDHFSLDLHIKEGKLLLNGNQVVLSQ